MAPTFDPQNLIKSSRLIGCALWDAGHHGGTAGGEQQVTGSNPGRGKDGQNKIHENIEM